LLKKLQAYNLQDQGMDTVDANIHLGHLADEREYTIAALILANLKVQSIQLITNNPNKIEQLKALGVNVKGRISIQVESNCDNQAYLQTKAEKMDHFLNKVKK
jgi:3,4-dihydroxy 2-butanone 4-phosphate synthase/GTP cyclohydrolase II